MNTISKLSGVALLVGGLSGCGPAADKPATPPAAAANSEGAAADNEPSQLKENAVAGANTKTVWNAHIVYTDGDEQLAGQLAVEGGVLSVVSAVDEENREYLAAAVERLNAKEELYEMVAPVGEERYTLMAKIVGRDDSDFERVLADTLLSDHDLRVEPAN